jgi:hypothetical protein
MEAAEVAAMFAAVQQKLNRRHPDELSSTPPGESLRRSRPSAGERQVNYVCKNVALGGDPSLELPDLDRPMLRDFGKADVLWVLTFTLKPLPEHREINVGQGNNRQRELRGGKCRWSSSRGAYERQRMLLH